MDRTLKGNVAQNYGLGRVYLDFNFTTGAAGAAPTTVVGTTMGTAGAGQAPPPVVATITHSAAGTYVVQLSNADTFNKVIYLAAELDDTANDGAYCTCGSVSNEGTSTGLAFTVFTRAGATTTKTDYASRKISVTAILRNTIAGQ